MAPNPYLTDAQLLLLNRRKASQAAQEATGGPGGAAADAGLGVEEAAPVEALGAAAAENPATWGNVARLLAGGARGAVGPVAGYGLAGGLLGQGANLLSGQGSDAQKAAAAYQAAQQAGDTAGMAKAAKAYDYHTRESRGIEEGGLGAGIGAGLGSLLGPLGTLAGGAIGGGLGLLLAHHPHHYNPPKQDPAAPAASAAQQQGIANTGDALQNMVKTQMAGLAPYIQDMISSQNATSALEKQAVAHLPPGLQGIYNAANVMQANTVRQLADSFAVQQTSLPYQQMLASIPIKFQQYSGGLGILPTSGPTVNQNLASQLAGAGLPGTTPTP